MGRYACAHAFFSFFLVNALGFALARLAWPSLCSLYARHTLPLATQQR
jgi:hypothetical protein